MLQPGTVVRSIAGHDKNRFYVIVESDLDKVKIVDGKMRKLQNPKTKNIKHIRVTNKIVSLEELSSNKALKRKLEPMNQLLKSQSE